MKSRMAAVVSRSTARASASRPTVAVLGWAGSTDKHLIKFTQLYYKRGTDTIRFTAKTPGLTTKRNVEELANVVEEELSLGHTLAFHVFSMNGVYTLTNLQQKFPKLEVLKHTRGIFFDSSPVHHLNLHIPEAFDYNASFDYVVMPRLKNANILQKSGYYAWKNFELSTYALDMVKQTSLGVLGVPLSKLNPYHYLLEHPQLPKVLSFVYSDGDTECRPKTIDDFISEVRRDRRRIVDATKFSDSKHVQHMKLHPNEYEAAIDRFLSNMEFVKNVDTFC